MRTRAGLDVAGVGEDDEPTGDPLRAFQQGQGMGEDIVAIFGGEEGQADRHGERGLEVEGVGRGDRRVEDIAGGRLKIGAVEHALLGIEAASIQHGQDPAGETWPAPSGS